MFSVGTLPTAFTRDYADSAGISQIPNHPCSSVPSVVKNPTPPSVVSVFSVGTLPTVLTKDYADSAGVSLIPNHPCSSVTSVVKNSESDSVSSVSSVFSVGTLPTVLTTDHTDTIWIRTRGRLSEIPSIPHPLPIRGKNALVDSEPVNHGSHGYDPDKNPGRLSRIRSTPHPLRIRGKTPWSIPNLHLALQNP